MLRACIVSGFIKDKDEDGLVALDVIMDEMVAWTVSSHW